MQTSKCIQKIPQATAGHAWTPSIGRFVTLEVERAYIALVHVQALAPGLRGLWCAHSDTENVVDARCLHVAGQLHVGGHMCLLAHLAHVRHAKQDGQFPLQTQPP